MESRQLDQSASQSVAFFAWNRIGRTSGVIVKRCAAASCSADAASVAGGAISTKSRKQSRYRRFPLDRGGARRLEKVQVAEGWETERNADSGCSGEERENRKVRSRNFSQNLRRGACADSSSCSSSDARCRKSETKIRFQNILGGNNAISFNSEPKNHLTESIRAASLIVEDLSRKVRKNFSVARIRIDVRKARKSIPLASDHRSICATNKDQSRAVLSRFERFTNDNITALPCDSAP